MESHDGLFEIADDDRRHAGLFQLPQQCELQRIGILKFVDHKAVDPADQGLENVGALVQQLPCCRDHVGVVNDARLALGLRVVKQHLLAGRQQHVDVFTGVR